ncbi:hypothetical protein DdX_11549 [Ditylenchus destructor]|uniref:Uncharacterized protein n=1 Tax=Ditylenchus destructor TaxID=166010 RepID=A0AAD4N289_9BILA|nr:hypothetical protein DdX_11549 [Ditylenchus destructor]
MPPLSNIEDVNNGPIMTSSSDNDENVYVYAIIVAVMLFMVGLVIFNIYLLRMNKNLKHEVAKREGNKHPRQLCFGDYCVDAPDSWIHDSK